jgi:hypothetical protein
MHHAATLKASGRHAPSATALTAVFGGATQGGAAGTHQEQLLQQQAHTVAMLLSLGRMAGAGAGASAGAGAGVAVGRVPTAAALNFTKV